MTEGFPSTSEEEAVNAVMGVLGILPAFSTPPYGDFLTSPYDDSPFDDPLTTPAMGSADMDLLTSPLLEYNGTSPDLALFSDMSFFDMPPSASAQKPEESLFTMDDLYPMTPITPSLDPTSLYSSPRQPSLSSMPAPSINRRKSSATGTRKNITPDTLVPIDAPTQPRKYQTPSATSRKELPAVFAKKRSRSQAFGDEEDELNEEPLPPNATDRKSVV